MIEFNAESHTYTLEGVVIPSVTDVLQGAGLIDYSFLPEAVRTMALSRGRRIHSATQFDDEDDLEYSTVAEEIKPYLRAWRRFREETGFKPDLIEYRGFHRNYRYAGTLDRTGCIGDERIMLDIKSNKAEPWVLIQTAAYAGFFDNPRTYRRMCVELRGDGTYNLPFAKEMHSRYWQEHFNDFLMCLGAHRARAKYGPRKETAAA